MRLLILFLVTFLFARENPFMPVDLPKKVTQPKEHSFTHKVKKPKSVETVQKPIKTIQTSFATLIFYEKSLKIQTKDPFWRTFINDKPLKLVLDFKKRRSFGYKKVFFKHPLFSKVEFAAHKKFYRIAITLKKRCRYKVKKEANGLKVVCALKTE